MAHCLLAVGDLTLTIAYSPNAEITNDHLIQAADDHLIQVVDNETGTVAAHMVDEQLAMLLLAAFCVLDTDHSPELQETWRRMFPQSEFNP